MQRRAGNRRSRDFHGSELRHGRDFSRAADLEANAEQRRFRLFRRVFERDRPARRVGLFAERPLQRETVELDDGAVRRERVALPQLAQFADFFRRGVPAGDFRAEIREREAPCAQRFAQFGERRERSRGLAGAEPVDEGVEPSPHGFFRILRLDRSRREVARIRERLQALGFAQRVDAQKFLRAHEDFAADFDEFRHGLPGDGAKLGGNAGDVRGVAGDVVAFDAVPARERAREFSVFVDVAHGKTVDFRLDQKDRRPRLLRQFFFHARAKREKFALGIRVVQALHRHTVADFFKAAGTVVAHGVRRRIRPLRVRERAFERFELRLEAVVFEIGNHGRGVAVIARVVLGDFFAEPFKAFFRGNRRAHGKICAQKVKRNGGGVKRKSRRGEKRKRSHRSRKQTGTPAPRQLPFRGKTFAFPRGKTFHCPRNEKRKCGAADARRHRL